MVRWGYPCQFCDVSEYACLFHLPWACLIVLSSTSLIQVANGCDDMTITIWTINTNNLQRACMCSRTHTGLLLSTLEWSMIQWLIYKVEFSLYYGSTFNMSHCSRSITWVTQCLRSTIIVLCFASLSPHLTTMSYNSDGESELSEQEKQEVFQDLLSGAEYILQLIFYSNISMYLFA